MRYELLWSVGKGSSEEPTASIITSIVVVLYSFEVLVTPSWTACYHNTFQSSSHLFLK